MLESLKWGAGNLEMRNGGFGGEGKRKSRKQEDLGYGADEYSHRHTASHTHIRAHIRTHARTRIHAHMH